MDLNPDLRPYICSLPNTKPGNGQSGSIISTWTASFTLILHFIKSPWIHSSLNSTVRYLLAFSISSLVVIPLDSTLSYVIDAHRLEHQSTALVRLPDFPLLSKELGISAGELVIEGMTVPQRLLQTARRLEAHG